MADLTAGFGAYGFAAHRMGETPMDVRVPDFLWNTWASSGQACCFFEGSSEIAAAYDGTEFNTVVVTNEDEQYPYTAAGVWGLIGDTVLDPESSYGAIMGSRRRYDDRDVGYGVTTGTSPYAPENFNAVEWRYDDYRALYKDLDVRSLNLKLPAGKYALQYDEYLYTTATRSDSSRSWDATPYERHGVAMVMTRTGHVPVLWMDYASSEPAAGFTLDGTAAGWMLEGTWTIPAEHAPPADPPRGAKFQVTVQDAFYHRYYKPDEADDFFKLTLTIATCGGEALTTVVFDDFNKKIKDKENPTLQSRELDYAMFAGKGPFTITMTDSGNVWGELDASNIIWDAFRSDSINLGQRKTQRTNTEPPPVYILSWDGSKFVGRVRDPEHRRGQRVGDLLFAHRVGGDSRALLRRGDGSRTQRRGPCDDDAGADRGRRLGGVQGAEGHDVPASDGFAGGGFDGEAACQRRHDDRRPDVHQGDEQEGRALEFA